LLLRLEGSPTIGSRKGVWRRSVNVMRLIAFLHVDSMQAVLRALVTKIKKLKDLATGEIVRAEIK
jgi:hypothetical protein